MTEHAEVGGIERGDDAAALAGIVARVKPADVAQRMVARFRSEIAGYQRLPEPVVANQIVEISRQNVELFFRSILEGRNPTEDDLTAFRESARDRAAEGMPLEDLLHAYRLGGRLGWQAITEAAQPDERLALIAGAERQMDYVDRVTAVVAQAYLDERQHLVSEEERRLRNLFDVLVRDAELPAGLHELAERIGLPVAASYRPFTQTLPGSGAYEHAEIAGALRGRGVLALTEGNRVTGLLAVEAPPVALGDGTLLAIGEPTARADLSDALEELRMLVDLGAQLGQRGTIEPDAFAVELLLARSPRLATQIRRRVLGALEEYAERRGSDLVETLEAFLDSGLDRRAAAQRLHVHPNTLDYRLRRATELTGLDLGRTDDLALTVLALKQRALSDDRGASDLEIVTSGSS